MQLNPKVPTTMVKSGVLLILDASASMQKTMNELKQIILKLNLKTFDLILFSNGMNHYRDIDYDRFNKLQFEFNSTHIHDSVKKCVEIMSSLTELPEQPLKVILLTDGHIMDANKTKQYILDNFQLSSAPVDILSVRWDNSQKPDTMTLAAFGLFTTSCKLPNIIRYAAEGASENTHNLPTYSEPELVETIKAFFERTGMSSELTSRFLKLRNNEIPYNQEDKSCVQFLDDLKDPHFRDALKNLLSTLFKASTVVNYKTVYHGYKLKNVSEYILRMPCSSERDELLKGFSNFSSEAVKAVDYDMLHCDHIDATRCNPYATLVSPNSKFMPFVINKLWEYRVLISDTQGNFSKSVYVDHKIEDDILSLYVPENSPRLYLQIEVIGNTENRILISVTSENVTYSTNLGPFSCGVVRTTKGDLMCVPLKSAESKLIDNIGLAANKQDYLQYIDVKCGICVPKLKVENDSDTSTDSASSGDDNSTYYQDIDGTVRLKHGPSFPNSSFRKDYSDSNFLMLNTRPSPMNRVKSKNTSVAGSSTTPLKRETSSPMSSSDKCNANCSKFNRRQSPMKSFSSKRIANSLPIVNSVHSTFDTVKAVIDNNITHTFKFRIHVVECKEPPTNEPPAYINVNGICLQLPPGSRFVDASKDCI